MSFENSHRELQTEGAAQRKPQRAKSVDPNIGLVDKTTVDLSGISSQ